MLTLIPIPPKFQSQFSQLPYQSRHWDYPYFYCALLLNPRVLLMRLCVPPAYLAAEEVAPPDLVLFFFRLQD